VAGAEAAGPLVVGVAAALAVADVVEVGVLHHMHARARCSRAA
jgi:hypothetical protein